MSRLLCVACPRWFEEGPWAVGPRFVHFRQQVVLPARADHLLHVLARTRCTAPRGKDECCDMAVMILAVGEPPGMP